MPELSQTAIRSVSADLQARIKAAQELATIPAREAPFDLDADIEAWEYVGDPLAEAAVRSIRANRLTRMDPLAALLQLEEAGDEAAANYLRDSRHVPDWVDFDAMAASGRAGRRNPVGMMFGLHGGMGLTYVDPDVADVMALTGRVANEQAYGRRMWETFTSFIGALDVEELRPGGEQWALWVRIRIMHTRVRMGLVSSGKWDPNRRTAASALEAATPIHLFGGYRALLWGLFGYVTPEEVESAGLTWRWICKLVGAPPEFLAPTFAEQLAMDMRIDIWVTACNDNSRALMSAAMAGMRHMFPYNLLPRSVHEAVARVVMSPDVLLGRQLDDLIAKAPAHLELPSLVEEASTVFASIADDMAIPRHPILERVVLGAAAVLRGFSQLQRVPVLAGVFERVGDRILESVLQKGLAGIRPDYSTHVDRHQARGDIEAARVAG